MTAQTTADRYITARIAGATSHAVVHVRYSNDADGWDTTWDEVEAIAHRIARTTGEEQDISTAIWDTDHNVVGWERAGVRVHA